MQVMAAECARVSAHRYESRVYVCSRTEWTLGTRMDACAVAHRSHTGAHRYESRGRMYPRTDRNHAWRVRFVSVRGWLSPDPYPVGVGGSRRTGEKYMRLMGAIVCKVYTLHLTQPKIAHSPGFTISS